MNTLQVPGGGDSILGKRRKIQGDIVTADAKRTCALVDLHIPIDQTIVVSGPSSPRRSLARSAHFLVPPHVPTACPSPPALPAADIKGVAVYRGEIVEFSLRRLLEHSQKWVMIVFFPQHFTWIRPEAIIPFCVPKLRSNCEVILCSHDSQYALQAWHKQLISQDTQGFTQDIILLSDLKYTISSKFSLIVPKVDTLERTNNVSLVVLDNTGACKFTFPNISPSQQR